MIQVTTGRPYRPCYSGLTAATSPFSPYSTVRRGGLGTSGTPGRVLRPYARHCASGEAHADTDRPLATR
jgi:hypothetical protein